MLPFQAIVEVVSNPPDRRLWVMSAVPFKVRKRRVD